jgi:hypothetical protein
MPAGLAQGHAGGKNPRPADEALLDRLGEPTIVTSRIADCCKAALDA